MSEPSSQPILETASVSDRGLNEKRPHNEDSFLLDAERRIFVVADGVGGANAGEVASKTAVEVLDEAFRHHQIGEDAEDLMEIAIQRANASIHQMSREQKDLASMATTVVALHLDGNRATVGHVGDSRLYRLDAAGVLHRETDDHSVVEEEVRAGRMTAEQAATHPSRNVISRALGAEPAVEVDLKTFDFEDGTTFLLCSDGITRHLPDSELGALLRDVESLDAACEEMKRRCFERGAEDNLTAVVVRSGAHAARAAGVGARDDDATLITERNAKAFGASAGSIATANATRTFDTLSVSGENPLPKKSRISGELREADTVETRPVIVPPSPTGRAGGWLGTILLLLIVGSAAFYGGLRYQQEKAAQAEALTISTPSPTPTPGGAIYESLRRQVDAAPATEMSRMAGENGGRPLDSTDPVFLSLYGRALLLSGRHQDATVALKLAEQKMGATASSRDAVAVDTRLALAAAALKGGDGVAMREATESLGFVIENPAAASPTTALSPAASASPPASATPLR
ncbi:MAG TPA: PP2C family serine/threonine-protein phosphatase [Pyrinomonadaceae bacterium]|jgi:protein phosphatase|nr:PP2C family serine/threonine-protein phosphatase [Pyrinomonadaceae bacterium]